MFHTFVVLWWHLRIAFAMLYTDAFKGKKIKLEYALFINSLQYSITVLSSSHQLTHSVIPTCNEEDTITKTLPRMRCRDLEGFRAGRSADQTVYRLTWSNNSSPTETTLPQTFRLPVPSNHRVHLCDKHWWIEGNIWIRFFFLIGFLRKHLFIYLSNHRACGMLAPQLGIKPMFPALEAQSLNHWTVEVPSSTSNQSTFHPDLRLIL